jgi:TolA-binding protein
MASFAPICLSACTLSLVAVPVLADHAADAYREARAQLAARRYAEAAARFEAAAATTNTAAAAAAWFGRGEALYGLGQWDAAATAYGTLLKSFPSSPLAPQALYARGHAEQQAGRLPQALATFTAFKDRYPAHALTPACVIAIGRISSALEAQARQQALAAITRELAAINALVRAEKFAEAGAAADRFLQAHPGHPQTAELRYLGAVCAYRAKDFARAAEAYRTFLDRHPQHARAAEARSQLGDSLFQAGRYDEARGLFEKMAGETLDPQEEARMTLAAGDCHAAQQKWDEAEQAYLSVEVLQGCDALRPVALKRLADLYEKRGQPDQARRAREDLRRRYPGSE